MAALPRRPGVPTVATLAALAAASGHGNVAEHEAPWCAGNQAVKFCLQEPPDDSAGGDYDDRHKPLAPETAQLVAKTVAFLAERLPSTSNKLVINAWDEDASTWLRALGPHGAWLQHIGLLQRCTEELHLSRLAFVEGDLAALAVTLQSLQRLTLDSCDFPAASPLLELRPLASLRHLRLVNCNLDINTLEHVSALAELAASPGLPVLESVMVEDALEFNRLAMEQLNFAVEAGQEALALRGRQGVKFGLKVT